MSVEADFQIGGVEPEKPPVALDRALAKLLNPLIEFPADSGPLAAREVRRAQRSGESLHASSGNTLHPSLPNDAEQGLFDETAPFQELGKAAAFPELGNQQFEVADAGFPAPFPIAVALIGSSGTALVRSGADESDHFLFHDPIQRTTHELMQKIARRQLDLRDPSR